MIKGGFPSGKLLDALHSHGLAVAEVIHNDHLMALLKQDNTGVAADISGAAGDKDPHKRTLLPDFQLAPFKGRACHCDYYKGKRPENTRRFRDFPRKVEINRPKRGNTSKRAILFQGGTVYVYGSAFIPDGQLPVSCTGNGLAGQDALFHGAGRRAVPVPDRPGLLQPFEGQGHAQPVHRGGGGDYRG